MSLASEFPLNEIPETTYNCSYWQFVKDVQGPVSNYFEWDLRLVNESSGRYTGNEWLSFFESLMFVRAGLIERTGSRGVFYYSPNSGELAGGFRVPDSDFFGVSKYYWNGFRFAGYVNIRERTYDGFNECYPILFLSRRS